MTSSENPAPTERDDSPNLNTETGAGAVDSHADAGQAAIDAPAPAAAEPAAEATPAAAEPAVEAAAVAAAEPERPGFDTLGLDPRVLRAVKDLGYETPSAIQSATIPVLLEGRDVVGLAQTGTGKTAAFALPILSRIVPGQGVPQALVIAPTRELALQVCEAFGSFAAHLPEVHMLPVYGGQAYGQQLSALRRGVDIIVGTPGRIMDHLKKGTLDLSQIKYLVLDEADEMLKMGFAEDVETILADTPKSKQVALFSATMPTQIRRISQQYLNDAAEIKIQGKTQTSSSTTQRYVVVSYSQKIDALTRVLEVEDFDGMIVFTRTRGDSEQVAEKLRARGYSAAAINGDVPQNLRERMVEQLKSGALDILVATDVAARGLDVERISHVINYDLPIDTESYVHRIGRTGRAGRSGDAISFVTPRERRLLTAIEKATKQPLTQMPLPNVEQVNATRLSRFDDAITASLEKTARVALFRDIIAHYVRHHDVPETDVAAALAIVAQGKTPLLLTDDDDRKFERDRKQAASFLDGSSGNDRDPRGGRERPERTTSRPSRDDLAMYRIAVGRRHKVLPGQIVGALANEGGLSRDDFGRIQVRDDFSLVELPKNLTKEQQDRLAGTRISGKLIELGPDRGPQRDERPRSNDRGSSDRGGYKGNNDRGGERGGYNRDDRPQRDNRGTSDRGGYNRDDRPQRDSRSGGDSRGGYSGGDRSGGYKGGDNRGGDNRGGDSRGGGYSGGGADRKPRW